MLASITAGYLAANPDQMQACLRCYPMVRCAPSRACWSGCSCSRSRPAARLVKQANDPPDAFYPSPIGSGKPPLSACSPLGRFPRGRLSSRCCSPTRGSGTAIRSGIAQLPGGISREGMAASIGRQPRACRGAGQGSRGQTSNNSQRTTRTMNKTYARGLALALPLMLIGCGPTHIVAAPPPAREDHPAPRRSRPSADAVVLEEPIRHPRRQHRKASGGAGMGSLNWSRLGWRVKTAYPTAIYRVTGESVWACVYGFNTCVGLIPTR